MKLVKKEAAKRLMEEHWEEQVAREMEEMRAKARKGEAVAA